MADPAQACPICAFQGEFQPGGPSKRPRAMCPGCGSLERQRLAWLYMSTETDLLARTAPRRFLHLSPDRSLFQRLTGEPHIGQLTADLNPAGVMVRMDIQNIPFPDNSFDVVYCSHVLDHVPDDRKAMSELLRVLAPTGWAMIQVPLRHGTTEEGPAAAGRPAVAGRSDRLRFYGFLDYENRLAQAGFHVTVDAYPRRIGRQAAERFGLTPSESVYIARKPAGGRGRVIHPLTDLVETGERQGAVVGRVEQVSADNVVRGWAWKPASPDTRLQITVHVDGQEAGAGVADRKRDSLAKAGIGDGKYCFGIRVPKAKPGTHRLRVEADGALVPPTAEFSIDLDGPEPPMYVLEVTAGAGDSGPTGTRAR